MSTLTAAVPDDQLLKLKEKAARLNVSPEGLVRASIEELLARPEEEFQRAAEHVVDKNADLDRRLA